MSKLQIQNLKKILVKSYWLWWLYHHIITDSHSFLDIAHKPFVKKYLSKSQNLGVVCDLGSGPGRYTKWLNKRSKKVFCVDVDFKGLKNSRARHRDLKNTHYTLANAYALPFEAETFDTVICLEVLEHLEDDLKGLHEIKRVLKPNGRLVASVPVPPGYVDDPKENPYGHKREGYTLDDVTLKLEKVGLYLKSYTFCLLAPSRVVLKINSLWRRIIKVPIPIFIALLSILDYLLMLVGFKSKPADIVMEITIE